MHVCISVFAYVCMCYHMQAQVRREASEDAIHNDKLTKSQILLKVHNKRAPIPETPNPNPPTKNPEPKPSNP